MASNKYFIDPLAEELGIKYVTSKRILTALVWDVIKSNCSITSMNTYKEIRSKLMKNLMDDYFFTILEISDRNLIASLMCNRESQVDADTLYEKYIYPFVQDRAKDLGIVYKG